MGSAKDDDTPGLKPDIQAVEGTADLGAVLRQLLRQGRASSGKRLTCRELAERTGYGRSSISNWLAGRALPSADGLDDLLIALGVTGSEQRALATARDQIEERRRPPTQAGSGVLRRQQLYRNVGAPLPGKSPRESTHDETVPPLNPAAAASLAVESASAALSRSERGHRALPTARHIPPALVTTGVAVCIALLITVVAVGLTLSSGHSPTAPGTWPASGTTAGQDTDLSVATPALACGADIKGGFRSPATTAFLDIETVYTVSLDGVSANVLKGLYNGITYDWVTSHPTGSRVGMQLKWSDTPGKWYYCTATIAAGSVSALPGQVATIAVPATVRGRQVIYQACIWHQRPFTEQCSGLL